MFISPVQLTAPCPACLLQGAYDVEQAVADGHSGGQVALTDADAYRSTFAMLRGVIEAKQLLPVLRTQYVRTSFQVRTGLNRASAPIVGRHQRQAAAAGVAHAGRAHQLPGNLWPWVPVGADCCTATHYGCVASVW